MIASPLLNIHSANVKPDLRPSNCYIGKWINQSQTSLCDQIAYAPFEQYIQIRGTNISAWACISSLAEHAPLYLNEKWGSSRFHLQAAWEKHSGLSRSPLQRVRVTQCSQYVVLEGKKQNQEPLPPYREPNSHVQLTALSPGIPQSPQITFHVNWKFG